MNRPALITVLLLVSIAVSGCNQPAGNFEFKGELNASDGSFSMEGHIDDDGAKEIRWENVSVYLYDQNGSVLNRTNVGPIGPVESESREFSLTSDRRPKYIIIYSPEFRAYENMAFPYYVWEGDRYGGERVEEASELPITPQTVGRVAKSIRILAQSPFIE